MKGQGCSKIKLIKTLGDGWLAHRSKSLSSPLLTQGERGGKFSKFAMGHHGIL